MISLISKPSRRQTLKGLACIGALCLSAMATAQNYPNRPITLVVAYPPGGSTDVAARSIAPKLGELLGANVIIDNKPGASTSIGTGYVAKAPADGYTLLMAVGSTLTLNPAIRPNLPYDPLKSFDPIGQVSRTGLVLIANPKVPINSVAELVASAKSAPDKWSYASFGTGTSSHFAGAMAFHAMGTQMMHVPYKGSAPAMNDLIGGQVPFAVDTTTAVLPQLKAGKIKALAVASPKRSPLMPQVPTFSELGYPDVKLESWTMVVAPKGLPAAVQAKLEKAFAGTMADAGVRKRLLDNGLEPSFSTPAQATALIESELPMMRATAVRANIQAD